MKKIIAILLALVSILSLAACGGKTTDETTTLAPETTVAPAQLEGTLKEIADQVIAKATAIEFMMGTPDNIDLSDIDLAKYYIGVDPTDKVEEAVYADPMINAQAFSMCLIKAKKGADIEALKNEILESIDMRKWICVEAEKLIVSNCGDTILMVMGTEAVADDVYNAFNNVASGTASPALTKAGAVAEVPPVDGGEADIDAPAAMPEDGEGIILG